MHGPHAGALLHTASSVAGAPINLPGQKNVEREDAGASHWLHDGVARAGAAGGDGAVSRCVEQARSETHPRSLHAPGPLRWMWSVRGLKPSIYVTTGDSRYTCALFPFDLSCRAHKKACLYCKYVYRYLPTVRVRQFKFVGQKFRCCALYTSL